MAAPRLEEMVQRLRLARHAAALEDELESDPPRLILTLQPWRGPWTDRLAPPSGAFVLELEPGLQEHVIARFWLETEAHEPSEESRLPASRIGAEWLEGEVVRFVERLLARA
jgi:hypothetical protein